MHHTCVFYENIVITPKTELNIPTQRKDGVSRLTPHRLQIGILVKLVSVEHLGYICSVGVPPEHSDAVQHRFRKSAKVELQ